MTHSPRKRKSNQSGCVFIVGIGMLMTVLLVLNALFVRIFFSVNLARIDERVFHAAQFIIPIALLFIEFWLFDTWSNRRNRRQQESE